jgi:hypothetical protein
MQEFFKCLNTDARKSSQRYYLAIVSPTFLFRQRLLSFIYQRNNFIDLISVLSKIKS